MICDCRELGLFYICCGECEYDVEHEALIRASYLVDVDERKQAVSEAVEAASSFAGRLELELGAEDPVELPVPSERSRIPSGLVLNPCRGRFDQSWKSHRKSQYREVCYGS